MFFDCGLESRLEQLGSIIPVVTAGFVKRELGPTHPIVLTESDHLLDCSRHVVRIVASNQDAATVALKEMPFEFGFPLRDYQQAAIKAVESALAAERRSMLLAMATGTGKTKLAIALLYRLLATKRFRRICLRSPFQIPLP